MIRHKASFYLKKHEKKKIKFISKKEEEEKNEINTRVFKLEIIGYNFVGQIVFLLVYPNHKMI